MMSPASSSLALIVVNYGAHALVETNVAASIGTDFAGRVVIVDNLSTSAERAAITEVCDRHGWTLVASADNSGFGGGNNQGVDRAIALGSTEFLFLNPDAKIDRASIEGLHQRVLDDPLLLVAPLVLRADGQLYSNLVDVDLDTGQMVSARRRTLDTDMSRVHPWASGACFMLTRQLWESIGGFDDDYFLYWEDVDLCHRAALVGGRVEVDSNFHAVHDEGGTHGFTGSQRAKSPLYYRYNIRNRLVYAAKHLTRADQRRWLRSTPRASYAILLQGGRRQFIRPDRNLWPALRGAVSGYLAFHRILRSGRGQPTAC